MVMLLCVSSRMSDMDDNMGVSSMIQHWGVHQILWLIPIGRSQNGGMRHFQTCPALLGRKFGKKATAFGDDWSKCLSNAEDMKD
jgi:hypothetical protein